MPRQGGGRVSIHAPTGGATRAFLSAKSRMASFQFTRPRGARLFRSRKNAASQGFNSRAHGGRDRIDHTGFMSVFVSIHAPTGGATIRRRLSICTATFQFTRPRGARRRALNSAVTLSSFNSRAHGGRDRTVAPLSPGFGVSIHAPTGGATCRACWPRRRRASFNSRAHGGRDHRRGGDCDNLLVSIHAPTGGATWQGSPSIAKSTFQFTRPRGARPTPFPAQAFFFGFNSRAHGGRDPRIGLRSAGRRVSIHAPTGGATIASSTALTR